MGLISVTGFSPIMLLFDNLAYTNYKSDEESGKYYFQAKTMEKQQTCIVFASKMNKNNWITMKPDYSA